MTSEWRGLPFSQDRCWRITGPNFVVGLTDYNWEITGYPPLLQRLFPRTCKYGGNAYYLIGQCQLRGWKVENVDEIKMVGETADASVTPVEATGQAAVLGEPPGALPEPVEPDLPTEPLLQRDVP